MLYILFCYSLFLIMSIWPVLGIGRIFCFIKFYSNVIKCITYTSDLMNDSMSNQPVFRILGSNDELIERNMFVECPNCNQCKWSTTSNKAECETGKCATGYMLDAGVCKGKLSLVGFMYMLSLTIVISSVILCSTRVGKGH